MIDLSKLSDAQIIAKTAWGENRGGNSQGMQSVINVIMNRASKPSWWGKTAREVCLKPWQFDCWNEKDPNYQKLLDADMSDGSYVEALNLAYKALSGDLEDLTNGSFYYFAKTMNPWPVWARGKQPCADIAGQLFFNNITEGKSKMTNESTSITTPAATNAALGSLVSSLTTIAKNDLLKGLVPVLDGFLNAVQANQGGTVGLAAQVNALGPALLAALPNVGAQAVKDEAGAVETSLNAAAAKAETPNGANG